MNPEHDYYIVCLNLIEREWERNRVGRVRELLESTKNNRYRGVEWGYWNQLSHRGKRILRQAPGSHRLNAKSAMQRSRGSRTGSRAVARGQ